MLAMNLLPNFNTVLATSPKDQNFGNHIGEECFHRYFKQAKDQWIQDFLAANRFVDIHFLTRKYSVEIRKEVIHPSVLRVYVRSVSFEGFRLVFQVTMESPHYVCAEASFELIAVDVKERKMISKTTLHEKFCLQSDHYSV